MAIRIVPIFNTDALPIVGGATGALTQVVKEPEIIIRTVKSSLLPSLELIICAISVAAIGSVVGYLIKMLLDRWFHVNK